MRISSFIIFLILGMALTGSALLAILASFNPHQASGLVFILLYSSLFLFLAGLFCLIIFAIKKAVLAKKDSWQLMSGSIRQALILATAAVISLFLWQRQRLNWWSLGMVLGIFAVLELFFKLKLSRSR